MGADWRDGPAEGGWIAERLGPFGPSVGHAVPHGYAAYAAMRLWQEEEPLDDEGPLHLAMLLDVLAPFTPSQPVTCGIWEGFSWLYEAGEDPRTAPGMSVDVWWLPTQEPTQAGIDKALAEGQEHLARTRVARPAAAPLELPNRRYHLCSGPLAATLAFDDKSDPPSLIWPQDRSWFLGLPIYTNEIAVAGSQALIEAVIADSRLKARHVTIDDVLDLDD